MRRVFLAVLAAVLTGCSFIPTDGSSAKVAVKSEGERKAAPEFALKDANGTTVKLSDYKGKVVLINFWATWCGPCKVEIPWFIDFEKTYKDRDFAVLGVSLDEDGWPSVKPYVDEKKINYRVLLGNDELSQLYGTIDPRLNGGVDQLPTTMIVDRKGRIASIHIGLVAKATYVGEIQNLLEAPKDDTKRTGQRSFRSEFAFLRAN
jgi:peroxiredoxin